MQRRASLALLMGLIVILALAMGAMKAATEWLARGVVLSAFVVLLVATLGAIVRRLHRPAWIGYAIFGWGHLIVAVISPNADLFFGNSDTPSGLWRVDGLAETLAFRFYPELPQPVRIPETRGGPVGPAELKRRADFEASTTLYEARLLDSERSKAIGVAIQGVVFALIGGVAAHALSDRTTNAGKPTINESTTLPG